MSYDPFESLVRGLPTGYEGVLCIGAVSPGVVRYLSDKVGARVHVCDFDEQRLQFLQSEMQENSAVQYHNALPLFEAGDLPEIGYHCSEPTHSSLALPSGITEILPGLLFEPVEVEALAFTDLFEEGNFSTSEANLLILATNGYEASWLAKESALAALFSAVLIRSPRSNCFEKVDTQVLVGDLAQSGLPAISLPMGRPPYESIAIHHAHDWQGRGEEITNLKAALEAADTDAAALGQRISLLEAELGATSTTLQASDEAKNSLEAEYEALRSSLSAAEEEVSSKSASLSNLEDERVKLGERVSSLEAELSSTSTSLKVTEEAKHELESMGSRSSKENERLKLQVANLLTELKTGSSQLDACNQLISEFEERDIEVKAEHRKLVDSLQERIDTLEQAERHHVSSQRMAQETIVKNQLEMDDLRERHVSQARRIEELMHLLKSVNTGFASLGLLSSDDTVGDETVV